MATQVFYRTTTPHSIVINAIGDGAGGSTSIARATLLAQCAEGPLKRLLTQTTDWTFFNLGAAGVRRIHVREVVDRVTNLVTNNAEPTTLTALWTANTFDVDVNGECQIEIRFQQSERR